MKRPKPAAIAEAANYFGSQGALARQLGVSPMAVSNWKRRWVPVERAIQIERLTSGEVSKEQLRPDVFCLTAEVAVEEQC
ncbi:Cro/CI family transcriptional regulator [uncultured Microbulbifer sp.]|uniref:transcriptional regulator n=1 Tax=uncultured Microbulbifer sp. TaxID=348147 RepID=UPI00262ECBE6|nr:Cro/CI family transcriptional regulator [uncultured Microbulbifer sp.]